MHGVFSSSADIQSSYGLSFACRLRCVRQVHRRYHPSVARGRQPLIGGWIESAGDSKLKTLEKDWVRGGVLLLVHCVRLVRRGRGK